ncbi:hypothetical protein [Erwinia billingiae]|uniref:hypothetical protein n=1 Tax=Erwinia billingiae TaxID=182337 RepID=UPI0019D2CB1C|nr:hypothetical protein [Erwinia billingiae]
MKNDNSNISSMPELVDFEAVHSAVGRFVILHASYRDPLAQWCTPTEFPDTAVSIKLKDVKRIISELQYSVDMIEAGVEHPSSRTDL